MPRYVVASEGPIRVHEIPEGEVGGGPIIPERPSLPPGWEKPELPPREEWPPLPPWFQPGVGLPIPPTPEMPWVPVDPPIDPPEIWPPLPGNPSLPDLSGKTLALVRVYVSRHVNFLRWMVIDHAEAKAKVEKAIEWAKANAPVKPAPH